MICRACKREHSPLVRCERVVTNESPVVAVTNKVTNKTPLRIQMWRQRNKEKYNARQREYMRKVRVKVDLGAD